MRTYSALVVTLVICAATQANAAEIGFDGRGRGVKAPTYAEKMEQAKKEKAAASAPTQQQAKAAAAQTGKTAPAAK